MKKSKINQNIKNIRVRLSAETKVKLDMIIEDTNKTKNEVIEETIQTYYNKHEIGKKVDNLNNRFDDFTSTFEDYQKQIAKALETLDCKINDIFKFQHIQNRENLFNLMRTWCFLYYQDDEKFKGYSNKGIFKKTQEEVSKAVQRIIQREYNTFDENNMDTIIDNMLDDDIGEGKKENKKSNKDDNKE